eukprot:Sspe_Gene.34187::Locus_16634_Transcript_1_1_Confidence_1.000_Length_534::g.34187::m.34187
MLRRAICTQLRSKYTVAVKDRCMVAHSFKGAEFGPAQNLHGATLVVTAHFKGAKLNENNTLVDIVEASRFLEKALDPYRYQNLDTLSEFEGENTTVERIAKAVCDSIAAQVKESEEGNIEKVKVRVEESDVAFVEYGKKLTDE